MFVSLSEGLINFCHGGETFEILISLGNFLWSVLPPLTCAVHVGNCIVLSLQFCSRYFVALYIIIWHHTTQALSLCHTQLITTTKTLLFFTIHILFSFARTMQQYK